MNVMGKIMCLERKINGKKKTEDKIGLGCAENNTILFIMYNRLRSFAIK